MKAIHNKDYSVVKTFKVACLYRSLFFIKNPTESCGIYNNRKKINSQFYILSLWQIPEWKM